MAQGQSFYPSISRVLCCCLRGSCCGLGPFHGHLWHIQPAPCFHSTVPDCPDPCFQKGLTEAAGGGQSDFWKALQSDSAAWLLLRDPESTWHQICLFSLLVHCSACCSTACPCPHSPRPLLWGSAPSSFL